VSGAGRSCYRWNGRRPTHFAASSPHGPSSARCGLALANLAVLAFSRSSGDQFLTWGWRIPFFLSIVMVGIGLYIRLRISETPVFARVVKEERVARAPSIEVIKRQPRRVVLAAFARIGEQAAWIHLYRLHLHLRHSGAGGLA
jgi:MFS family permease